MKKTLLALAVCVALTNCAGFNQAVAAKEKSSVIAIQTANDNVIDAIRESICAVPYGAIIRHPEFVGVAKAACLPTGTTNAPATLLDVVPTPATQFPIFSTGTGTTTNAGPAISTATPAK